MVKANLWSALVAALFVVAGVLGGCSKQPAAAEAPSAGFALHIDAKKHINDAPDLVVHHYCKAINDQVSQCLLFDSDEANARLIGVETIISPQLFAGLPEAEKANWHYHETEIPQVEASLPGLSEKEAAEVVASLEDTYGKVVIFWHPGEPAPVSISVTRPH
ncbi:MAG: DUF1264 domain-containing protein [Chloroflexi bacterium]|nr:DUF1264 domain-containing protein [Chloroflexota bacterium]